MVYYLKTFGGNFCELKRLNEKILSHSGHYYLSMILLKGKPSNNPVVLFLLDTYQAQYIEKSTNRKHNSFLFLKMGRELSLKYNFYKN